jgi:N-acetylneuraminate synthase
MTRAATMFPFEGLFVFDIANNHQGSAAHGQRIIEEVAAVARNNGIRAALKFQFRHLDTFIHPASRQDSTNKHIPRFLSTRLSPEDQAALARAVVDAGLMTMATPFDERSVQLCADLDIQVLKIASCSATDWPLLECVAEANKPVIFSTGGLTAKQIDDLVSFFEHRQTAFAIMHCVAIYPTPDEHMQLNQIASLCARYPNHVIGFSTHERPDDTEAVLVAVAKGALMLERHVGVETDQIKLNAYSSTPSQLDRWIKAALRARALSGGRHRPVSPSEETAALHSLWRGVYALKPLKAGVPLTLGDVFFAMPYTPDQVSAGEFRNGATLAQPLEANQPMLRAAVRLPEESEKQVLFTAIHTAKAMLNEARIALPTEFETEFSHHYGVGRFPEVGIIMVTCVNRSYCKKLVIQLPGQRHPAHYHKRKEETFQILHGVLEMIVEGRRRTLYPGDTQLIQQGVWHEFWTESGVIFEEISTTHFANDSYYADKVINQAGAARKTLVNQWGRYQI